MRGRGSPKISKVLPRDFGTNYGTIWSWQIAIRYQSSFIRRAIRLNQKSIIIISDFLECLVRARATSLSRIEPIDDVRYASQDSMENFNEDKFYQK